MNEFGGNFDMASLPAEGIERVEVNRSQQSALCLTNALTGVINIVRRRGEGPPSFTALAEGGSYATRRFATGGSGLIKGFSWSYKFSRAWIRMESLRMIITGIRAPSHTGIPARKQAAV